MVYRGRILMVVFPDEPMPLPAEGGAIEIPIEEFEMTGEGGNGTITINVDGSAMLAIEGDDGTSVNESLEVMYAGVGVPF